MADEIDLEYKRFLKTLGGRIKEVRKREAIPFATWFSSTVTTIRNGADMNAAGR